MTGTLDQASVFQPNARSVLPSLPMWQEFADHPVAFVLQMVRRAAMAGAAVVRSLGLVVLTPLSAGTQPSGIEPLVHPNRYAPQGYETFNDNPKCKTNCETTFDGPDY